MIFSVLQKNRVWGYCLSNKTWWKPRFLMHQRPLVKGRIANFGIFQTFLIFAFWIIFSVFQTNWVFGYSWSTLLWHRCYYPHRSRAPLSPVGFLSNFLIVVQCKVLSPHFGREAGILYAGFYSRQNELILPNMGRFQDIKMHCFGQPLSILKLFLPYPIFHDSVLKPIQSITYNVRPSVVCLCYRLHSLPLQHKHII